MKGSTLLLESINDISSSFTSLVQAKVLIVRGRLLGSAAAQVLMSHLRDTKSTLRQILIDNTSMGAAALDILALADNPYLSHASAVACGIGDKAISKLNWVFEHKGSSLTLDISKNFISDSSRAVLERMARLPQISTINVGGNFLTQFSIDETSKLIVGRQHKIVERHRETDEEKVWLAYYNLPPCERLARAAESVDDKDSAECAGMEAVTRYDVLMERRSMGSGMSYVHKLIMALGTGVYAGEPRIICGEFGPLALDLSYLDLDDDALVCIVSVARYVHTLLALDIRGNNITTTGAKQVMSMMNGLVCLRLEDNPKLEVNGTLLVCVDTSPIQIMSFDSFSGMIKLDGLQVLCVYNTVCPIGNMVSNSVRHMGLDGSSINMPLSELVCLLLDNFPLLEGLSVRSCGVCIDKEGIDTVLALTSDQSQLTELYLDGNPTTLSESDLCSAVRSRDADQSIALLSVCDTTLFADDKSRARLSRALSTSIGGKDRLFVIHVGQSPDTSVIGLKTHSTQLGQESLSLISKRAKRDEAQAAVSFFESKVKRPKVTRRHILTSTSGGSKCSISTGRDTQSDFVNTKRQDSNNNVNKSDLTLLSMRELHESLQRRIGDVVSSNNQLSKLTDRLKTIEAELSRHSGSGDDERLCTALERKKTCLKEAEAIYTTRNKAEAEARKIAEELGKVARQMKERSEHYVSHGRIDLIEVIQEEPKGETDGGTNNEIALLLEEEACIKRRLDEIHKRLEELRSTHNTPLTCAQCTIGQIPKEAELESECNKCIIESEKTLIALERGKEYEARCVDACQKLLEASQRVSSAEVELGECSLRLQQYSAGRDTAQQKAQVALAQGDVEMLKQQRNKARESADRYEKEMGRRNLIVQRCDSLTVEATAVEEKAKELCGDDFSLALVIASLTK